MSQDCEIYIHEVLDTNDAANKQNPSQDPFRLIPPVPPRLENSTKGGHSAGLPSSKGG